MKITPEKARIQNRRLVLKTIYDSTGISRAQISRETKLTRPTVSDVVTGLIDDGLVEEVGLSESTVGRRGILLKLVDDSYHLIGLDLGRGDFRGAVINLRGKVLHQIELPLESKDGNKALSLVYELVDQLVQAAYRPLLGIGVGAPGPVDFVKGVMHHAVNLRWRDIPLRDTLQERYQMPVYMANDCQVAALAELTFGKSEESIQRLVLINIGWGVGSGIIHQNQIIHGEPLGAGEIGHVVIESDGELCTCGNYGCLETIASSRAMIRQAQNLARKAPLSLLNHYTKTPEDISIETICKAVHAGDEYALQVLSDAGRALGIAISNIVGVLGGRKIFITGKVTCFGDHLLAITQAEMNKRVLPLIAETTEINFSNLGPNIVLMGASALLLQNELGLP